VPSQSLNLLSGESFGPAFANTKNSELHTISKKASVPQELSAHCTLIIRAQVLNAVANNFDEYIKSLSNLAESETSLGLARL
jgi:TnpA family transposase